MEVRLAEIHDDNSIIKVLAIRLVATNEAEERLLEENSGYRPNGSSVLLFELDSEHGTTDPMRWPSMATHARTLPIVHQWIINHFDQMKPDGVHEIDVVGTISGAKINPDGDGDDIGDPFSR